MGYLDELNDSQREAVVYCDGPSLVIAGAGSGKTRVLTYKIAHLIGQGFAPWNILALTFTNKAAREMRDRVVKQVGHDARGLWMGTFHSVFSRILRMEAHLTGYSRNFTIYDAADSKSLVKSIVKGLGLDDKVYKTAAVAGRISMAKNFLITPEMYENDMQLVNEDKERGMERVSAIYKIYQMKCRKSDAMDFDDLLVNTYRLFEEHEDARLRYADQFRFVLVDEYQDTNFAQHEIIHQLTRDSQRLCVVGDDAQSIYSFRGARIENILRFTKRYSGARVFKLERNYRSTRNIVGAANSLIANNKRQIKKDVFSENVVGDKIKLMEAFTDREEALRVRREIVYLHKFEGSDYDNIAILYRTNAQSRVFEEEFRKVGVPYRIYGGLSFYQRKEIKDVVAYFRLVINHDDEEAVKRVVNYPTRGIGQTTQDRVAEASILHDVSRWSVMLDAQSYSDKITAGPAGKLRKFVDMIDGFAQLSELKNAYEIGSVIVRASGMYNEIYSGREAEDLSRQENLQELLNGMKSFVEQGSENGEDVSLPAYLASISLLTDQDEDEEDDSPKVTLMTVHASKGLEFENVFVVGLEDGLFPSQFAMENMSQMEEERRLLYVAITRAEKRCFLSYANSRYRYGSMEMCRPSLFLKDIDSSFIQRDGQAQKRPTFERPAEEYRPTTFNTGRKISRVAAPEEEDGEGLFRAGERVAHAKFGRGTVLSSRGTGSNAMAEVEFDSGVVKNLLLKFAKLDRV